MSAPAKSPLLNPHCEITDCRNVAPFLYGSLRKPEAMRRRCRDHRLDGFALPAGDSPPPATGAKQGSFL